MDDNKNKVETNEYEEQKTIAFAAGVLQGDVTIREFLESIAQAVVFVEKGGRIVVTNSRAEELFEYTKQEMLGRHLSMLIPESLRAVHEKHVEEFFALPRMRPMGLGFSQLGVTKSGEEVRVEISLGHLETAVGPLALAFITDMTTRKRAEDLLQERNDELDAYARTVAHDLADSLAGLVAASDILSKTETTGPLATSVIEEIGATSRNLVSVVRELLAFATMDQDDIELVPVEMSPVVDRALDRLKMEAGRHGVRIVRPANLPPALGHPAWIEEIWFNYLANAIKYGGEGSVIEIGGERGPEDRARFWVKDQGPGIPAEKTPCIFLSGAVRPHAQGHGLGLPTVARIVKKLGGEVYVESEPEKGSCFGVVLPAPPKLEAAP